MIQFAKTSMIAKSLLIFSLVAVVAVECKNKYPSNSCMFYTVGYYDGLYNIDGLGTTYAGCRIYRAHGPTGNAQNLFVYRLNADTGGYVWSVSTSATDAGDVQMTVTGNDCCPPHGLVLKHPHDSKYDTTILRANTVGRYPVSQLKSGKVSATPLDYSAEVTAIDPLECVRKQLDVDKYITGVSYSKSTSKCYPIYDNTVTTMDNSDFITAAFSDIAALNGRAYNNKMEVQSQRIHTYNPTDCARLIINNYFGGNPLNRYPNGYWLQRETGECVALFDAHTPYEYYNSYEDMFGYIVANQFGQTGPTRTTTPTTTVATTTIAPTTAPTTTIATTTVATTTAVPTTVASTTTAKATPVPPVSPVNPEDNTTSTSTATGSSEESSSSASNTLVISASCAGAVVLLGGGYYMLRSRRTEFDDGSGDYDEGSGEHAYDEYAYDYWYQ